LEVAQSPGVAAVQVMTIHKSKGLGFDVVVIPDVPADGIPQAQYFTVAEGPGWLTQTPPKWARDLLPAIRETEASWATDQRYEAMCMLYVALTRAKRGLYVLLEQPPKSQDEGKASLANWLATSLQSSGEPGLVYQRGGPDWVTRVPELPPVAGVTARLPLGAGVRRRQRLRPSEVGPSHAPTRRPAASALQFGSAVHAAFEQIGWLDDEMPVLPPDESGKLVAELIGETNLRAVFERRGRQIELFREQPIDAVIDGKWLSGIVDRMHLHRDSSGLVCRVEVIDFKTDVVPDPSVLLERHANQLRAYRTALELAYPGANVSCHLLSTRLRQMVEVD
jgi:ATP-dependent exoDNAse (exonuclease V) beta subunit